MKTPKLIVEMLAKVDVSPFGAMSVSAGAVPVLDVPFDADFQPVAMPQLKQRVDQDKVQGFGLASEMEPTAQGATVIQRVTVPDGEDPERLRERLMKHPRVVDVFADVVIAPQIICPGSPAMGTDADVERLLSVPAMRACGMDGSGVTVAIVDTGFNVAYLNAHGKTPTFDAARSWSWNPAVVPGRVGVNHGTMCAFDVCIAAPKCTLIDVALLGSSTPGGTVMEGLLSDAVRAYAHLLSLMTGPTRPGQNRSLVVNNSWGMFHPSWDYPPGNPLNYSDNPNHPFNRIVATLATAGADILFAAGNCGPDCPDGRCSGITANVLYGANSHPAVTTVAGADTSKKRVGYSSVGPGRLSQQKPDITGYTHFKGSGVYAADGGTSAATPVVAGVVAAVRTVKPYDPTNSFTHPPAVRALLTSTAEDRGDAGFDYRYGWGIVNGAALKQRLCTLKPGPIDLCKRFPFLCKPNLCKRYPWLCFPFPPFPPFPIPRPPFPPGPGPDPVPPFDAATELSMDDLDAETAYMMGLAAGLEAAETTLGTQETPAPKKAPCGCGGGSS